MPSSASSSTAELLAKAARTVSEVAHRGRALDDALAQSKASGSSVSPPALQALSTGTLRWYSRFTWWIDRLAARPMDSMQPDLSSLLAVALHQLNFSRHPEYAIVDAAVDATKRIGQPKASGFVNAVLRNFLRNKDSLRERVQQDAVGRFAHPKWLIDRVRKDWPQHWEAVLEANNEAPPLWLRVNRLQGTVDDYLALLTQQGLKASRSDFAPGAVLLAEPVDVAALPGFAEGRVSVQDAGAQLVGGLLDARSGMRLLDACAAPGGKACHALELTPDLGELVMVERSASRTQRITENISRLRFASPGSAVSARIRTVLGDAGRPTDWRVDDGVQEPFDRILLDVPCSATGVIRRHPDIKVLRRPADIAPLVAEQLRLLTNLWPLLRPGGRLLYVSCSVLKEENDGVVGRFLSTEPAASAVDLTARLPVAIRPDVSPGLGIGWQVLPGAAGMDGFYYACLEKTGT